MTLRILLLAVAFALFGAPRADALLCHPILGCDCTVTASDVSFGAFAPLSGSAQTSTGVVTVDCTGVIDVAPSVAVKLDDGQWGSFTTRKMRTSGGDLLDYNIYTSGTHSVVWGDGTGGSSSVLVSGGLLSLGHWSITRTMYARATPATSAKPGQYSDTIVVRIDW